MVGICRLVSLLDGNELLRGAGHGLADHARLPRPQNQLLLPRLQHGRSVRQDGCVDAAGRPVLFSRDEYPALHPDDAAIVLQVGQPIGPPVQAWALPPALRRARVPATSARLA